MRAGRQWLVLDADLFANDFTEKLLDRFGCAGVVVWVALLCAAKRNRVPGQIAYGNEADALAVMGLTGRCPLQGPDSVAWTLAEFLAFTGRMKQTCRTSRGHVTYVKVTHWYRWQKDAGTQTERERKRRWRQETERDTFGTYTGQNSKVNGTEIERREETPPTPPTGGRMTSSSNGEGPKDLRAAIGALRQERGWAEPGGS